MQRHDDGGERFMTGSGPKRPEVIDVLFAFVAHPSHVFIMYFVTFVVLQILQKKTSTVTEMLNLN